MAQTQQRQSWISELMGPSHGSCHLLVDGVIAQSAVSPVWVAVIEEAFWRCASGTNRLDGGLQNGTHPAISKVAPAGVWRVKLRALYGGGGEPSRSCVP